MYICIYIYVFIYATHIIHFLYIYIHIYISLTKHGLKGSYSATKRDATSLAISGSPGQVTPGSPRFTISQSSQKNTFFKCPLKL